MKCTLRIAVPLNGDASLIIPAKVPIGRNPVHFYCLDVPTIPIMPNGDTRHLIVLFTKDASALLVMPGSLLTPFNVGSADRVADEIRRQKNQGADFIKVGLVSPDVFFAAIAEGKRVGLPVLGHLQERVDAAQASRAGFRSIEHLSPGSSISIGCSTKAAVLLAEAAQHPSMKTLPIRIPAFFEKVLMKRLQKRLINPAAFDDAAYTDRLQRAFDTYSEAKCRTMATNFVADHTWHVPTLVRLRTQELADSLEYLSDPAFALYTG